MILLNKLLDDGNVLYKVTAVNVLTDCVLCFIVTVCRGVACRSYTFDMLQCEINVNLTYCTHVVILTAGQVF